MKLEVVVAPVADVDRAKDFYKAPGSACSVIFGTGITSAAPGSAQSLQPVVTDIDAARAELAGALRRAEAAGSA